MAKAPGKRPPKKPGTRSGARPKAVPRSRSKGRQQRALADVARVLEGLEQPSAIIGGIAVIAWGYARFTADIDCAIAAPIDELSEVYDAFESGGFEPREEGALAFARESLVLLLRHKDTGVEVDVSLAQLSFELAALKAAVLRSYGDVRIRVPGLTDLFIYKLVACRPKDLQDVQSLLALGSKVDSDRITATLAAFDEVLETDRRQEWLRLMEKNR
jgi:hypothetical protein